MSTSRFHSASFLFDEVKIANKTGAGVKINVVSSLFKDSSDDVYSKRWYTNCSFGGELSEKCAMCVGIARLETRIKRFLKQTSSWDESTYYIRACRGLCFIVEKAPPRTLAKATRGSAR